MGRGNSGRGGVPPEKRAEIDRLIRAEWDHTRIAAHAGVNVSTVYRRAKRLAAGPDPDGERTTRCPGCGGSIPAVEHFCRVCYLRRLLARGRSVKTRHQKASRVA